MQQSRVYKVSDYVWEWHKNEMKNIRYVQLHEINARYEVLACNIIYLVYILMYQQ